jgi:hypothetical protein
MRGVFFLWPFYSALLGPAGGEGGSCGANLTSRNLIRNLIRKLSIANGTAASPASSEMAWRQECFACG